MIGPSYLTSLIYLDLTTSTGLAAVAVMIPASIDAVKCKRNPSCMPWGVKFGFSCDKFAYKGCEVCNNVFLPNRFLRMLFLIVS